MKNGLTITLCCNTAFGVANFRAGVVRELVALGHRVVVIAPEELVHFETLRRDGAECIDWPVSARGVNPWREVVAIRRLMKIYATVKPDVAFHYTIKPVIYGAIAASRLGIRSVAVITGLGYVFLNRSWVSRVARAMYSSTLRRSQEVWFLNSEDLDTFRDLGALKGVPVRALPSEGVDTSHFAPVPRGSASSDGKRTFLMVGRLLRDKGTLEFIEAARRMRQLGLNVRCQILGAIGDANPTAIAREEVQSWCAEGVVEYLGTLTDVRPAIAAADCIVLPSYREGVPRTLLEAASMARPLIATDVPGCRDVVLPGVSGLLCKVRDPESLAHCMRELACLDDASLNAMGLAGREFVVEQFDERIVIRLYLDALVRLTAPRSAAQLHEA